MASAVTLPRSSTLKDRVPPTRAQPKPEAIYEIELGAGLSAYEVSALSAIRTEWSQAVRQSFERASSKRVREESPDSPR